ncbi:Malate dehydrogenase [Acidilobus saccharovorans 345-15]|uniref:Malate dehydrogenase n=1 Tax=Acidilobus saccharovorans (strain DSM 16705 / JCM 18335 / VKM B-2471 / 345-15) TaxID=666510 RepID=D9Q0T1_ACIS3|nr:NADP-dependent malic enzyme [Acidilobus saccharovorans]ADL18919.1 Malate dehydrogenase [Acidilobus saccharovorans 345-15]
MAEEEEGTEEWYKLSTELHRFYGGKIEVLPKVPVRRLKDFAIWYTPGVAQPSRLISSDPDLSFELTSRWNTIAVVSDGTRVLGLGKVGPEAAYPVMEGKALLFKYLGGVDAVPIVHRARDAAKFVELLQLIEPSFGGINLEDIEKPKCFTILDEARSKLQIPVWHDDQQGTATAVLAGLINALKVVGKKLQDVRIVLFGAGASNVAFYRLLKALGHNMHNVVAVTTKGVLHPEMKDIDKLMLTDPYQYQIAIETGGGGLPPNSPIEKAFDGADVVIAASVPGPGVIRPEWVSRMNRDAVVFALANPVPEIWPSEARRAGARVVATGRSDFPNQVNNSLVFPAVFRGVLDVRARTITDTMAIAAAVELAKFAEERGGVGEERILPTMEEWEVYPRVAAAVAVKAVEEGVARRTTTYREELERATEIIGTVRQKIQLLWGNGIIPKPPVDYQG